MADHVNFTRSAADRIARVVRVVEYGNRDGTPPSIDRPWFGGGGGSAVRLGRISASWLKGATATVTRLAGNGDDLSPAQTFEATNHFVDISVDCGPKKVACAKVSGVWILIAAEC